MAEATDARPLARPTDRRGSNAHKFTAVTKYLTARVLGDSLRYIFHCARVAAGEKQKSAWDIASTATAAATTVQTVSDEPQKHGGGGVAAPHATVLKQATVESGRCRDLTHDRPAESKQAAQACCKVHKSPPQPTAPRRFRCHRHPPHPTRPTSAGARQACG